MIIYHFIYKTQDETGKYYIGRHSTQNINDGYLGSGKWVSKIKNKSNLSREILEYADSIEILKQLEEKYISEHINDLLCMNINLLSCGFTSEEARNMALKRSASGTHNFQLDNNNKRIINGTHNFLKRSDGSSVASDSVKNGKHNLLKRQDGSSTASDRVKAGTNPFLFLCKGQVACYNKSGIYSKISIEIYHSQIGEKENWEYVHVSSKEGKKRKIL